MSKNSISARGDGRFWTEPGSARTEPSHRHLIAALVSFGILVLGLAWFGFTGL